MFYVVRALSPYTEYEFYVIGVNNIGRGPPSAPATCTTGETGNVFVCGFYSIIFINNIKACYFHIYIDII